MGEQKFVPSSYVQVLKIIFARQTEFDALNSQSTYTQTHTNKTTFYLIKSGFYPQMVKEKTSVKPQLWSHNFHLQTNVLSQHFFMT